MEDTRLKNNLAQEKTITPLWVYGVFCVYLLSHTDLSFVGAIDLATAAKLSNTALPGYMRFIITLVNGGGEIVQVMQPVVALICIITLSLLSLWDRKTYIWGSFFSLFITCFEYYVSLRLAHMLGLQEGDDPTVSVPVSSVIFEGLYASILFMIIPSLILGRIIERLSRIIGTKLKVFSEYLAKRVKKVKDA